jgi:hypothetical protein
MPIVQLNGQCAVIRLQVRPDEVEYLLDRHAMRYPGAKDLETQGSAVIDHRFSPTKVTSFVKDVCSWGRGHRLVSRILSENPSHKVASTLHEAYEATLSSGSGEGVERIKTLRYLGQSFASKMLRFMLPERAVILDEVIRSGLGYAETRDGYEEFLTDCRTMLDIVRNSDVVARDLRSRMRVCDIEAALFSKIQGY